MTTNPHTFTRRAALDPADEVTHDRGQLGTFSKADPDRYRIDRRDNGLDVTAQPSVSGLAVVGVAGGGSRIAAFSNPFAAEVEADDQFAFRRALLRPVSRGLGRARG
jgi:hypothetical protein